MKIVMAQFNPKIGDMENNTKKIIDLIQTYKCTPSDVEMIIFPETAITGYPPLDLLERPEFIDEQNVFLEKIKESTKLGSLEVTERHIYVVIGAFSKNPFNGKAIHNSLYVFKNGECLLKYNKMCLPTYNIFDELRHTEPGDLNQLLLQENVLDINGKRFAFLICEDALSSKREDSGKSLYKIDPVDETFKNATSKIDYLLTINASPSNIGKFSIRERVYQRICKENNVTAIYVNQCGTHDEIVFDGQSFVMSPEGNLTHVLEPMVETWDIVDLDSTKKVIPSSFNYNKYKLYYDHMVNGTRDYFHKQGFKKAVVGCSGGLDSALVLAVAVKALGTENVVAITMPSKVSSEGSVSDSKLLCRNLKIVLEKFPIGDIFDKYLQVRQDSLGSLPQKAITKQNIQPRLRTLILLDYANDKGMLLLNTSNKSELTVGYGTISGDLMGSLNPGIGDVWKTEVFELARYINKVEGRELIPNSIINKVPSAELEEGQFDENELGKYPVVDCIGKLYIEQDNLSPLEIRECQTFLRDNSSKEEVKKIVEKIDRNEFKRKQFCPIIRSNVKAFGCGRNLPIVKKLSKTHPLLEIWE